MSSVVVSYGNGSSFTADSGSLEVISPQGEANVITVKGSDLPVTIVGGALDDKITLGRGDSTVLGLDGDDMIIGGMGADLILGGDGDDTLKGGMGADTLKGGMGADVFELLASDLEAGDLDQILGFEGKDGEDIVDTVKIMGVSDSVVYNSNTGLLSVDGEGAIQIGKGLDLDISQMDDTDTWEIV